MTENELALLQAMLDKSSRYLEFGSGNSTRMAVMTPAIVEIDTVESSPEFVEQELLTDPALLAAVAAGRLRIRTVDLGDSKAWGTPRDRRKRHLWPAYPLAVFSERRQWDLVLVDGRFRIACCLAALLHLPEDARLMVHDFWHRVQYYPLLKFVEVVERVDSFGVFRRADSFDPERAQALIRKYQYLPKDVTVWQKLLKPFHRRLRGVSREQDARPV